MLNKFYFYMFAAISIQTLACTAIWMKDANPADFVFGQITGAGVMFMIWAAAVEKIGRRTK